MKYLITGGSGFLGSSFASEDLSKGKKIDKMKVSTE